MKKLQLMVLAATVGGCALIERQQDAVTENLLAKAGFQMRAATRGDSDLPPRKRWLEARENVLREMDGRRDERCVARRHAISRRVAGATRA